MENGTRLEQNKRVYRRYIELLNAQDFDSLPEVVDPDRYKEICVGFTPGWVNLTDAITSLRQVLVGIPDLNAQIEDCVAEGDRVYARLTVRGTNSGRFYGIPATDRSYEVSMFDYATIEDGRIADPAERHPEPDAPDVRGRGEEGRHDRGRRPRRVPGRSGSEAARLASREGSV